MTTIIATKDAIYADTQVTAGNSKFKSRKIFEDQGFLIGICGALSPALLFVEWFLEGGDPADPPMISPEAHFEAVIVDPEGNISVWEPSLIGIPVNEDFIALGSGSAYAMGAMACGATPQEAIEIAARFDPSTGLPIEFMQRPEKKVRKRRRAV